MGSSTMSVQKAGTRADGPIRFREATCTRSFLKHLASQKVEMRKQKQIAESHESEALDTASKQLEEHTESLSRWCGEAKQ